MLTETHVGPKVRYGRLTICRVEPREQCLGHKETWEVRNIIVGRKFEGRRGDVQRKYASKRPHIRGEHRGYWKRRYETLVRSADLDIRANSVSRASTTKVILRGRIQRVLGDKACCLLVDAKGSEYVGNIKLETLKDVTPKPGVYFEFRITTMPGRSELVVVPTKEGDPRQNVAWLAENKARAESYADVDALLTGTTGSKRSPGTNEAP